jgi:hypothetical protein
VVRLSSDYKYLSEVQFRSPNFPDQPSARPSKGPDEQAVLMLEYLQAVCSSPGVFEAARELIEQRLRKM